MNKPLSFILFAFISLLITSCSTKQSEIVLAEFSGEKITMGEFEKAYIKNTGGKEKAVDDSIAQYKNFLDLYVNFKMKLRNASIRGFDTNEELQNELADYKKKVGSTYIIEKELIEPGIKKLYEQRKYELRVSHLMVRPDSTGDEGALAKATELLNRIKNGESYEELTQQYSEDQFSKAKGGDIYYITAGLIVPEFENAAYETEVGSVYPEPVKTRFGYHLIKVTDKKERIPAIKASHIMVDFFNDNGEVDTAAAYAKMDTIKMKLTEGVSFADLAKQYSKDGGTKDNGGDLNFFQRRQMVLEFDEAAFNLNVGETSDVVKTNYGLHLIKVTARKPYPSFEEDKEELKKIYKQTRYNDDHDKLVSKLKTRHGFFISEETVNAIDAANDTVKSGKEYFESGIQSKFGKSVVFEFASEKTTLDELMNKSDAHFDLVNRVINKSFLNDAIKKISSEIVIDLESMELEKNYPEFAELMGDYKNGIYIFKLQDEEVWSKIEIDTVKLQEFYEKNKENYRWNDRVQFAEIFSRNDSLINHYYDLLKAGEEFDTLASLYTERPGFREKAGKFDLMDAQSSELAVEANKLKKAGDYSVPVKVTGGNSIVKLISKEGARIKTFEEAKAEVSGAFQEEESKRLESEYLISLKNTYKPVFNYKDLEKAFTGEEE